MFLVRWLQSACSWVTNLFASDEQRVEIAYREAEQEILCNTQTESWLKQSGWSACGSDPAEALRRPATRDAAIFNIINGFYQNGDDPARMLPWYTAQGLNNGTTTRTIVLNSGEGSVGRSQSNHQGALVIDEGTNPPTVTLAFRGMNPLSDWQSPVGGLFDVLSGHKAQGCQQQADLFWQGAGPEITRAIREVAARHGGQMPNIVIAGHSYGADAAARMVPKMLEAFPQARDTLQLVGFGALQTFTREEHDQLFALLGNSNERARQYMVRNDLIQHIGFGYIVGAQRDVPIDTGHVHYELSTDMVAMMDALHEEVARDPQHAAQIAHDLVDAYRRDPNSTLAQLAAYASQTSTAAVLAMSNNGSQRAAA